MHPIYSFNGKESNFFYSSFCQSQFSFIPRKASFRVSLSFEPIKISCLIFAGILHRDSIKVGVSEPGGTYVWKEQGYTSCSASCLGGIEELIINCVREDTGKVSSPFLCSPETKPEARIRTCNDRPCPPRWNHSDYSPCSKSCGIGVREREVQCIHEVTRGGENTMVVPDSMCPQPPPSQRQYCNILDCPVRWEVSAWSKCNKYVHQCGLRERCQQQNLSHFTDRAAAESSSGKSNASKLWRKSTKWSDAMNCVRA